MNNLSDASTAFDSHDHGECQSRILAEAEHLLAQQGARLTKVRRRTLEILLESHSALGAYEVLDRLAESGFGHQPPVAYRALEFLVQHGLAHRLQRLNAFTACLHPAEDHAPMFLICRGCNKVSEADTGPVRQSLNEVADLQGFRVERATVEVLGLCPACAAKAVE